MRKKEKFTNIPFWMRSAESLLGRIKNTAKELWAPQDQEIFTQKKIKEKRIESQINQQISWTLAAFI